MSQPAASSSDLGLFTPSSRSATARLWLTTAIACGLTLCVWLDAASCVRHGRWVAAPGRTLLFSTIALAGGLVYLMRSRRLEGEPLADLTHLIAEIRAGRAPLDDLARIEGPTAPLANQVLELLRELRQKGGDALQLEQELRQRVANRTEALERTIGSLRQQAVRDPLTLLFNRRMLDTHLGVAFARSVEAKQDLVLLMIDIDHFKHLNDSLGHAAGDKFLQNVAQLLRSSIREGDMAFRCGGDEFVVLLEKTSYELGQRLAGRLVSLVDGLGEVLKLSPRPALSVGVVSRIHAAAPSPDALLKHADDRLYEIKRSRGGKRS